MQGKGCVAELTQWMMQQPPAAWCNQQGCIQAEAKEVYRDSKHQSSFTGEYHHEVMSKQVAGCCKGSSCSGGLAHESNDGDVGMAGSDTAGKDGAVTTTSSLSAVAAPREGGLGGGSGCTTTSNKASGCCKEEVCSVSKSSSGGRNKPHEVDGERDVRITIAPPRKGQALKPSGCCKGGSCTQNLKGVQESTPLLGVTTTTRIRVANLCCEMEVGLVRSLLEPVPGVETVKVNSVGRVAIVRHHAPATAQGLLDVLNSAHLGASIQDTLADIAHTSSPHTPSSTCPHACVHLTLNTYLPLGLSAIALAVVYAARFVRMRGGGGGRGAWEEKAAYAVLVVAALPLALKALRGVRLRRADASLLMFVAVVGAVGVGDVTEALAVVFVVALADVARHAAMGHVARLLDQAASRLAPQVARVSKGNGGAMVLPLNAVVVGDVVVVRAGEQVPVDGEVVAGQAAVDESAVTGEAVPVEKRPGSAVLGGTICQTGWVDVKCTAPPGSSSLARIKDLVQEVAASRSPSQEAVDAFAVWYTPFILGLSLLTALAPPLWALYKGHPLPPWQSYVYRSLEVLVLGCPCAVVMAAPMPSLTAIAASAGKHVLFKSAAAVEMLGKIRVLACDKTGTLTEGRMVVTARYRMRNARLPLEVTRKLAASLEARSSHPLANAVVLDALGCVTENYHASGPGGSLFKVEDFNSTEGVGVEGTCTWKGDTHRVVVGNERALTSETAVQDDEGLRQFLTDHAGEAVVYVVVDGVVEVALSVSDQLRENARMTIQEVQALGIETALLTGDSPAVAARVQAQAGLTSVVARMKPADKLSWIRSRQQLSPSSSFPSPASLHTHAHTHAQPHLLTPTYSPLPTYHTLTSSNDLLDCHGGRRSRCGARRPRVAMVGDGINDGPSLMAADVGIAMGAHGTALAVQSADVVLLSDDLQRLPQAVKLSRAVMWIVIQNLILAVGIKLAVVLLVYTGHGKLWLAVAADGAALMAVMANGLRPLCVAGRLYRG